MSKTCTQKTSSTIRRSSRGAGSSSRAGWPPPASRCSARPPRVRRHRQVERRHQGRDRHARRHRLVLVRLQEGRRPGGEGHEGPRRSASRRCTRTTTSRSRSPGSTPRSPAGAKVIATSVPDASALKDPLAKAAAKGIVIITVNSGLGAFDDLADLRGARRPDGGHRGPGRRQAVQEGGRQEGADRDPRGQQLGPAAARRRRQEDHGRLRA